MRQLFIFAGLLALALLSALVPLDTAVRAEEAPSPQVQGFERFFQAAQPTCTFEASGKCVDLGFSYADRDRDGRLTAEELAELQADFGSWAQWKNPVMTKRERTSVAIGSYAMQAIGLTNFIQAYDSDGDGALTQQELLTDITLDERPLGQVLQDPEAVDWLSLQHRLGPAAPFLGALGAATKAK